MATLVARNDAQIVQQVQTLTPTVVNGNTYGVLINGKESTLYTADGSATAQEIVEGVDTIVSAYTAAQFPEAAEVTWTEDDATLIATGPTTGKPINVQDTAVGTGAFTVVDTTSAKSPNHWIAENFDTGSLPVSTDTVILTQLTESQSFYWGLDHNAVTLAVLDIRADSEAIIGLPEFNEDSTKYFQGDYRDTHLKIGVTDLKIGDGTGQGSRSIKIQLTAAVDCNATIYKTGSNPLDQDEAPVQLAGGTSSSTLQVMAGNVDLAMLPGYTGSWGTIVVNGGTVRCGSGVTLATVDVQGTIETRSAVTTLSIRPGATATHRGASNVTTANVQSTFTVQATGALTIATLNGYSGGSLDLSGCDSVVTLTNMNVYATPDAPFIINDPNNKLAMTNPAVCFNGVQSLQIVSGANKNLRIT